MDFFALMEESLERRLTGERGEMAEEGIVVVKDVGKCGGSP